MLKVICPTIQNDIVNAASLEITKVIVNDLGDKLFVILVDESRDISNKEQIIVVLRYVNKYGSIVERFLGVVHVKSSTVVTLKTAIDDLFCKHGLTTSRTRICGQGYNGASNMKGELRGMKILILRESPSAFYVHCFANQLQLALVVIAKDHLEVYTLFSIVSTLINVVVGSCKQNGMLRDEQRDKVMNALKNGENFSGGGLNQETSLKRPTNTRWRSHFATLVNLILMFKSVTNVLQKLKDDVSVQDARAEAKGLLLRMSDFDFALKLHLMRNVLGISNELSQALQEKYQDIVNAMNFVDIAKKRLQTLRDDE